MKVVALLSGGKDSLYNLYLATREGHEVVAIANLKPPEGSSDELDSYMYQTVGHQAIEYIAESLEKPLFRANITGDSLNKNLHYENGDKGDEVEQLYDLLHDIRHKHNIEFDAISVGAIASSYQKHRCENICQRLNLTMLAYLWNGDQDELLQSMIDSKFEAILVKVACLGLTEEHVGKTIAQMQPHLRELNKKYETNICGEGGEYETLVLNCPLFKKRIIIDSHEIINPSSSVYYMRPIRMHLE